MLENELVPAISVWTLNPLRNMWSGKSPVKKWPGNCCEDIV